MQLDRTVRRKSTLNCVGEIRNRLENMNPAEVSRKNIACPLPFVSPHVEHQRVTVQFIVEPEGLVPPIPLPPLKGQFPHAGCWCRLRGRLKRVRNRLRRGLGSEFGRGLRSRPGRRLWSRLGGKLQRRLVRRLRSRLGRRLQSRSRRGFQGMTRINPISESYQVLPAMDQQCRQSRTEAASRLSARKIRYDCLPSLNSLKTIVLPSRSKPSSIRRSSDSDRQIAS